MDKKDISTYLAIAGIMALSAVAAYYSRIDQKQTTFSAYAQKEKVSSEKTAALKALFESEGFKKGTSFDQRRLIEAVENLYSR